MYYYVREGVDGAMAYNNFKEGKAVKDAAAITADATNGEDTGGIEVGENNDITYSEMPVPSDGRASPDPAQGGLSGLPDPADSESNPLKTVS